MHASQRGLEEASTWRTPPWWSPREVAIASTLWFLLDCTWQFASSGDHSASPLQHKWMVRNPSEFIGICGLKAGRCSACVRGAFSGGTTVLCQAESQWSEVAAYKGRSLRDAQEEADS